MRNFVEELTEKAGAKLGHLSTFVVSAAKEVKIKMKDGDVDSANARLDEADEALDAGKALVAHLRTAISDGSLDAVELHGGALRLNEFMDEIEDVATGVDEDKVPPVE